MSGPAPAPPPLAFRLAALWARHAPRGRGALPRLVGRTVGRGMAATVRTRGGALLAVEPSSLDAYCAIWAKRGVWQREVLDRLLDLLRAEDGAVLYDIGANVGFFAMEAATALRGRRGVVHAFEPQPALARAVRASAGLNGLGNVHVHEVALGDRAGEVTLHVPAHSIHASIVPRERGAKVLRCRGETIDGLLAAGVLPPPSVVKIDVEGAELAVLQGARETFARHAPAILFEADANASRFGYGPADLCARLRELVPYEFFHLGRDRPPRRARLGRDMPEGDYEARIEDRSRTPTLPPGEAAGPS